MVWRSDGAAAPVRRDQVDVGRPVLGRLVEHGRFGGGVARGNDRLADLARRVVVLGPQPRRQAMDEQAVGAGLLDPGQELGQRRAFDGVTPVGEQRDLQVRQARADAGDGSEHRVGVDAVGQRPARRLADHRPVAGGVRGRDRQLEAVDLGRVEHTTTLAGCSMITDPWGEVVATAGHAEEIIEAVTDVTLVRKTREEYPFLNDFVEL